MSLLSELKTIITGLGLPVETGVFSGMPPDRYTVLTPLSDTFDMYADNRPEINVEEVRISIFDKGNYLSVKRQITAELLSSDITITDRRYVGPENDTGYNHYAIDVAKEYITNLQEE